MSIPITNLKAQPRRGATILEVMFAIGVLLFGLVGIAAVIPAASKLARNSIDFSRGSALGVAAASQFEALNLNNSANWRSISDDPGPAVALPTTGNVCIDPLFVSRPENAYAPGTTINGVAGRFETFAGDTAGNAFRRNRFPYYKETFNPLADPSTTGSLSTAWSTPRLQRVSLQGGNGTRLISGGTASRQFDDIDKIAFDQPEDSTLPSTQVFRSSVTSANPVYPAARSNTPSYSWFATIQPKFAEGTNPLVTGPLPVSSATASVVVIKQRDRTYLTPAAGEPLPDDLSERLALVHPDTSNTLSPPIGFDGGSGGTLNLVASVVVESEIESGAWLMLLKTTPAGTTKHAWYRVVQVDTDPRTLSYSAPVGPNGPFPVWSRGVTLEGPDWTFDANPTVAALIDGVISVIEFPVSVQ